MLHWWLLPLMAVISVGVWSFYLAIRLTGGPGVRTDGRTVVDKPVEEEDDSAAKP
jgi:hypothetical protein